MWKGDILVLKDGSLAEYVEHREGEYFPHIIKHLSRNVGKGTLHEIKDVNFI